MKRGDIVETKTIDENFNGLFGKVVDISKGFLYLVRVKREQFGNTYEIDVPFGERELKLRKSMTGYRWLLRLINSIPLFAMFAISYFSKIIFEYHIGWSIAFVVGYVLIAHRPLRIEEL